MFLTITEKEVKEIEQESVLQHDFCVGLLEQNRLRECCKQIGIEEYVVEECINNSAFIRNTIEVYEEFSFGIVSLVDMFEHNKMRKDIGFILQKNILLFVLLEEKSNPGYEELLQKALERIRQNATSERMTASVLEHILFKGNEELVFTENIMMALEKQVLNLEHADDISSEVMSLRSRVSTLKNFYDQMIDVGEVLQENTNDIFPGEELRYLKNFTTKAERMKERSQGLDDNLMHIWEMLDAAMNNKLNDTMKVLTIVSIIFQPLTMITGWYGMNFKYMWELEWRYGYLFVIILNILILIVISWIFKKKKML